MECWCTVDKGKVGWCEGGLGQHSDDVKGRGKDKEEWRILVHL